jgi:hypothetical protein
LSSFLETELIKQYILAHPTSLSAGTSFTELHLTTKSKKTQRKNSQREYLTGNLKFGTKISRTWEKIGGDFWANRCFSLKKACFGGGVCILALFCIKTLPARRDSPLFRPDLTKNPCLLAFCELMTIDSAPLNYSAVGGSAIYDMLFSIPHSPFPRIIPKKELNV